jgi:hypothetical protein
MINSTIVSVDSSCKIDYKYKPSKIIVFLIKLSNQLSNQVAIKLILQPFEFTLRLRRKI